jgi:structural maintenance of chromosome 4
VAELDKVTNERNAVRKSYDDLRRMRLEMFMDGFGRITLKLKEMYQMITLGGDAELELVDSLDPFSEGIVFSVRPPKKSWKNISNLSGGEKTLSSLALVFALHHFKPTPLYVMDEIDAALDFKNVSIVANYIKERTKNAQFVIISLRNNMFELADRLVGIYKTNNCTKSVSINPKAFGVEYQQNGFAVPATPALGEKTNRGRSSVIESSAVKSAQRRVSFLLAGEPRDSMVAQN